MGRFSAIRVHPTASIRQRTTALPPALGQLTIKRIIIHEVPRHMRSDTTSTPTYSEVESPLDNQLRVFFTEKLIETVGSSSAYQVEFDPAATSPVPHLVRTFLAGSSVDFVAMSKQIAKHLHDAQGGVSPGGLVTVVDCDAAGKKAIGILKLEKEEGVRLSQTTHQGKLTFDVSYIRDLILTRKTKLFKVGYFAPGEDGDPEGTVCDEQRGYMPRIEIAGFFLTTFLGCRLLEDPRVTTKHFFMAAQDFFNEQLQDPAERTEALTHLLSEITSQRARINVRQFARDYLPASQRQPFVDYLKSVGITSETIRKDISLIESQTKKMALEFESGVAVVGNRDAFAEHVTVTQSRDGAARVVVTDKLKRVKGK